MLYVLYLHFAHVFLVVKDLHPEREYFDFYLIDYWLIERVKGRTFAKLKSTYIVWEFTLHESYNSLKVLPGGFWLVASVLTSVRPNLRRKITPLHNVYFVKYDVTVSFMSQVLDTVTYFVSHVLVVDTVTYFGGNHRPRVWKSLKLKKVFFLRTRTSWDKYMFNMSVFFKF